MTGTTITMMVLILGTVFGSFIWSILRLMKISKKQEEE